MPSIFRRRPQDDDEPERRSKSGPFRRRPKQRGYDDPRPGGNRSQIPPELDPNRRTNPGSRGGGSAPRAPSGRGGGGKSFFAGKGRLLIALAIMAIPAFNYLRSCTTNPVTGRRQSVSMTADQEIQLGLQAAPQMMQQHGGVSSNAKDRDLVASVGEELVAANKELNGSPYPFEFHLLADRNVINAFALPGGQVFITEALLGHFKTPGEIAGVLGHEAAHVVARHGAERVSKMNLIKGITGAVLVGTYDPQNASSQQKAAMVMMVGNLVNLKYGRDQESESDHFGVKFMVNAGYHPESMIRVMEVLRDQGGKRGGPEFFSSHPNPDKRIETIKESIQTLYPEGLPPGLKR